MSTVPTRRSSVTPSGICTKGAARTLVGGAPAPIFSRRPSCGCRHALTIAASLRLVL